MQGIGIVHQLTDTTGWEKGKGLSPSNCGTW